ncbi:MAG: hypothetical protein IJJ15_00945 [Ruminococcus sp.]|nr:hypothetical protein [Ruminococcus sp.]
MKLPDFKRHPYLKGFLLTLLLIAVYLIVAVPFKVMEVIPGFTDIRPVMLLQPIYGIFFGIPGCLASAVGNLICDIISDSLRWSCIGGFAANFIAPFCFYFFCIRIVKEGFDLKKAKNLLSYCAVVLISAIIQTAIIAPMVMLIYPDVNGFVFILTVMLNNSVFPIFIGIPVIILMQEELGFKPRQRRIRNKTIH